MAPLDQDAAPTTAVPTLHPFPTGSVLVLDTVLVLVLLVLAPRYGWHRDELYFLEAGRHLAWGYIDQPPLVPFVARLADAVAPGNLVVLRTLPALATAATVTSGAALVRELGGTTRAQTVGAGALAAGGFLLGVGHLLSTATFDLTAWLVLLWLATRLLRTDDPRRWLPFGAVAGVALLNKHLVVFLVASLLVGLVLERRWRLLFSPWTLFGGALALAIAAPNLWWQAQNGWPQADMARALQDRIGAENRTLLLPMQVLFAGPAFIGVAAAGAGWLARAPEARPWRPLLWAWPAGLVAVFITAGRPYYVLPLTLTVLLAGVASIRTSAGLRQVTALVVVNGVVSALLGLPILPPGSARVTGAVNESVAETIGWPQLVDQVAAEANRLSPDERSHLVLLGRTYGEAAALDRFGPARGLPQAFSGHNAYADFRQPTDPDATVLAIRYRPAELEPYFRSCRQVAEVDNGLDVDNEVQGAPIVVCRGLRHPWPQTWERLRFLA